MHAIYLMFVLVENPPIWVANSTELPANPEKLLLLQHQRQYYQNSSPSSTLLAINSQVHDFDSATKRKVFNSPQQQKAVRQ